MKLWIALHRDRFVAQISNAINPTAAAEAENDLIHLEHACREDNGSGSLQIGAGYKPGRLVHRTKRALFEELRAGEVGAWFVGTVVLDAQNVADLICNDGTPVDLPVTWRALWTNEES